MLFLKMAQIGHVRRAGTVFFIMTLSNPQRGSSLKIIVQIFNLKTEMPISNFLVCFVLFENDLKLNVIQVFSTEGKL